MAPVVAHADDIELRHNYTGTIDYLFTGQPLTNNTGQINGVNCLEPNGVLVVDANMIPKGATLLTAQLYVAGSLIGNDGLDYPPGEQIFSTPNSSRADDAADIPSINALARQWASVQVEVTPPRALAPVTVSTANANAYVSVYYVGSGPETGNVGFFSTPIDITDAINAAGGQLAGSYQVGGVVADVCNGLEAVCGTATCSQSSALHTNGTASFALLLIFQDPSLPLRTVSVFEGLQNIFADSIQVRLVNGGLVSSPASASLTYFVVEGDASISGADPSATCGGSEYVTVQSVPPGPAAPLCLNDGDNPPGNIFNGSINTLPASTNPPAGCTGSHLCGLAGVDIDRYDISSALAPQAPEIDVEISTGSDRVGAAVLALGVDVYAPLLQVDSQFRVFGGVGPMAHVGGQLTYVLALSNTGNLEANHVGVNIPMPAGVHDVAILATPEGASTTFDPQGGGAQNGNLTVTGVTVAAGRVAEIRFSLTTNCGLDGNVLALGATVDGNQMIAFNVQATPIVVTGPGVQACLGTDPNGSLLRLDPVPALSGGGCGAIPTPWPWVTLIASAWALRRRRSTFIAAIMMLMALGACGNRHAATVPSASTALTSTSHLPGTGCPPTLMAQITRADGTTFCIDRFEASTPHGALGNAQQNADETSLTGDGSTAAAAAVALAAPPTTGVSWYQAQAACTNAQKRLCTSAEWELACRGQAGMAFPYGNIYDEDTCNGFYRFYPHNPAPTGSFASCVSAFGVYDLSGNADEWLADPVARTPGTTPLVDRLTHGGGFQANTTAMACAGSQFHAPPNSTATDRGFRCCADPND